MAERIEFGDLSAEVLRKDIKNVHLSVHPPDGMVRISAPLRMNLDTIRVFALTKLDWIKRQQRKFREQERETLREYLDMESHYAWGKRYLLEVIEVEAAPRVELRLNKMVLYIRPGAGADKKEAVVAEWYRDQLKTAVRPLIAKWEPLLGVRVDRVHFQRMKTRWGSCNPAAKSIRLNTELAKKPLECLEYIVVHEMVHLLEPKHDRRFISYMDRLMPKWRYYQDELNRLPVKHDHWEY